MSGAVPGSLLRSQRVGPSDTEKDSGYIMVELRNKRRLRVLHLNPRPRDLRFQQEMVLYLRYRKSGPSIMQGPLSMPRKQTQKSHPNTAALPEAPAYHPLSVAAESQPTTPRCLVDSDGSAKAKSLVTHPQRTLTHETNITKEVSDVDQFLTEGPMLSGNSSLFSSPTHTASNNTHSASSVMVALHNQNSNLPQNLEKNKSELKLPLNLLDNNSRDRQHSSCSNPPGPLSPQTQSNDASTCHALYASKKDEEIETLKSASSSVPNTASCDSDLVMFFIHGVGGSSDIWRGQTEYFANLGYEIVAPDIIGHGHSCAPRDKRAYHFREIAADMEELFDTFCKRRNVLIGHSYGASFATILARTRARRVSRLVLVSGGPPSPLAPQPSVFTLPTCMLSCIKPCLTKGFYKGAFNPKKRSVNLSAPRELAFQIPAWVLQHTMNGQDWPDGDELYHNWLTCPTLLLYGEMDGLVALEEEQEMHRAIFDSRLVVIPEASHMVMMEAPQKFNDFLLSFMQQPSPPHIETQYLHDTAMANTSSNRAENIPPGSRSKSRKSLRSAKTPRSKPQRLLSKSVG